MIPRLFTERLVACMALAVVATPWFIASVAAGAQINGSATYRERVALSPLAVFEAVLEDPSRADAPAVVIARVRKPNPGQIPIDFAISYDARDLDPHRRYVVRASILERGVLRFTGSQSFPFAAHGPSDVLVLMRKASDAEAGRRPREGAPALGELPATFSGLLPCPDCVGVRHQINLLPGGAYMRRITHLRAGRDESTYEIGVWSVASDRRTLTLDGNRLDNQWIIEDRSTLRMVMRPGQPVPSRRSLDLERRAQVESMEPRMRMTGLFRYMADAARFRDCRSGLRWPVATSDDYLAIERAYGGRRDAPGSELLVSLDGRIEQRPRMEGAGTEPTLVVERFLRALPGETCSERVLEFGLGNTRWRPIRIGDRPVIVSDGRQEPWIELDPRSMRVTGSGGCNRITGRYESGDGGLRFGPLISTKMACVSMETETAFLRALGETRSYRVRGRTLDLLDDRGRLLARLEERNLR